MQFPVLITIFCATCKELKRLPWQLNWDSTECKLRLVWYWSNQNEEFITVHTVPVKDYGILNGILNVLFDGSNKFFSEDAPNKDILVPNNPNRCNCIIDRIFTGGLQSDVTCQACK